MSFIYQIKLGGVNNLSDARFAAAVGINYIGFSFNPSNPAYIPPIKAKEIIDWTSGSHIVGEFGEQDLEEIQTISELLNIDIIELENNFLPDELGSFELPIIKKISLIDFNPEMFNQLVNAYSNKVQAFHFYDWENLLIQNQSLLNEVKEQVFLDLNSSLNNWKQILEEIKPFGIHLSGENEEKTGVRDFDELNDLLEQLTKNE
jgi:phosphoribosylanthranilate isomerase